MIMLSFTCTEGSDGSQNRLAWKHSNIDSDFRLHPKVFIHHTNCFSFLLFRRVAVLMRVLLIKSNEVEKLLSTLSRRHKVE